MDKKLKSSVNLSRRKLAKAGLAAIAFTIPLVTSFTKDGLRIASEAAAQKKPGKKCGAKSC